MKYNDLILDTLLDDPDGIVVFAVDRNYCFTFFSAGYSAMIRSKYGRETELGTSLLDGIRDPQTRENKKRKLDRAFTGETFRNLEDFVQSPLNKKTFHVQYSPVRSDGQVSGVLIRMSEFVERMEKSEAEVAYEMLVTNTTDAIFVMHAEGPALGKILSANESAATMHGYTYEEFLHLNIKDFDSPEATSKFDGRLERLLNGEKLYFEVVHKKKDGTLFPLEVITWMILIKGEKFAMSINRDITERKEIAAAVRERERFIESITNSSPDVIYVFDFEKQTNIYSSGSLTNKLDYTPEDIKNIKSAMSLMHPEDIELLPKRLERWKTASDTDVIETEFRLKNKAGEWRWFLARDTIFKRDANGKVIQTVGIVQERTDSKRAELELRQSEERFKRLQEASFGGIGIHDNGKMLDANQGLADMTGYTIEELMGMDGLLLIAPEYREHVIHKIRTGYEQAYDVIGLKKDGTRYNLEVQAKNIPFQNRMVRVTEFRDISERKQIEESIREQNIRLGDIADNLTRKNEQLEEFTQIVSHNLRAPVGNIVTLLTLYDTASAEERIEYIQHLRNSSALLLGTLNELNEVLKIKQSHKIERQQLDFKTVYNNVCQMLSASITELSATLESDFSEAPMVLYPNIYLESILLNLLSNALKYHAPGRKPIVTTKTHLQGTRIILEVRDNGLGINLDRYGHQIFKMRKTFHEHPESRGLGLFLIKNQIESMGGEISLTSEVNKGTTFYIKLAQ